MKRGLVIFGILLIFLFNLNFISPALGISPAKTEINYDPGESYSFNYQGLSDSPNKEILVYLEGPFSEWMKVDKSRIMGNGNFKVDIKLPKKFNGKPGKNLNYIVLEEVIDPELSVFLSTRIIMKGLISVYVPYPGKYLELNYFKVQNMNVGEKRVFEFGVSNRGKENLTIHPKIEIYSKGKLKETLSLKERFLVSGQSIDLKKEFDSGGYVPGGYSAKLVIEYGKILSKEEGFKIGNLNIKINQASEKIKIGGNKEYWVEIESEWNDPIELVHADIKIINKSKNVIYNFKTSPDSLVRWEKKNLTGFIDTDKIREGTYDANITVNYFSKEIGESNTVIKKIKFYKELDVKIIVFVIMGGVILILVFLLIILLLRKRKNEKRKK